MNEAAAARQRSSSDLIGRVEALHKRARTANLLTLPLWLETQPGTPNGFLRDALFAAIHSKDRKYFKSETLGSQSNIVVKYTGEQLN